jgi:hypothetical protein
MALHTLLAPSSHLLATSHTLLAPSSHLLATPHTLLAPSSHLLATPHFPLPTFQKQAHNYKQHQLNWHHFENRI